MLYLAPVVAIALWATAAARAETTEVLEPAGNQTVLSAYKGHVVWNELEPQTGRWFLRHWHAGTSARLPIASRAVQFDVDLGPGARGAPVAVYSRCAREPAAAAGLALSPDWMTARGCDIYRTALSSGKERRVRRVSTGRGSETTPSVWWGQIAFARRASARRTARLYVRRSGQARAVRLPRGTVPRRCRGCEPRPHGGPDALDLGRRSLSYLWRLSNGNSVGHVAWELRTVRLSVRRSVLVDAGYVGECEISYPLSPNTVGTSVIYARRIGGCTTTQTPITSFRSGARSWRQAEPTGGFAYALASDRGWLYWLRGNRPEAESAPSFDPCRAVGCQVVRSRNLRFDRTQRRKVAPPTF